MNAWSLPQYGKIEDLTYGNYVDPECARDQVLVCIKAAALNPADLKLITGKDGGKFLHASNFPIIPGFDFSGIIEKVGENVRDLKLGQEVFGFLPYARSNTQGTLSDYVAVNPNWISPKPTNVSHAEAAAACTAGCTALQGLRDKGVLIGDQHILINGASGGVGSFAIQIAKYARAKVWGTCGEKNMNFVRSLGADEVIDYRKTSMSKIDGKFDIIFDVASTSSFSECVSKLKLGGNYITLLPSLNLVTGKLRSLLSSKGSRFVVVKSKSKDLAQLASWMAGGHLKPAIGASYKMKDAPAALRHLKQGVAGKIVVTF